MRYLTGFQPTGDLHLGNYLGALRPALNLPSQTLFCVANYHALTTIEDPERLNLNTQKLSAALLALVGEDESHMVYLQSDIPEVQELAWILSCLISTGTLERGHVVKSAKEKEKLVSVGTYNYPVLMAADILLMEAEYVPVGKDQHQHLETAQILAERINRRAGKDLVIVPQPLINEDVGLIPGTDGQKMSKSYNNTIPLFLPFKLKSIKTYSTPMSEPMNPDACTVFNLYRHFATPEEIEKMRKSYQSSTYGYGHAKADLTAKLEETFKDARERYFYYLENYMIRRQILFDNAELLRPRAQLLLSDIKEVVGL